jgi:hypothetical protein
MCVEPLSARPGERATVARIAAHGVRAAIIRECHCLAGLRRSFRRTRLAGGSGA